MDEGTLQSILKEIEGGKTLTGIGYSYGKNVVDNVLEDHQKLVEKAMNKRTILLAEEALDVARASVKETAASDKLLVDTIKWVATTTDPDRFSVKPTDDVDSGHHVIITGIVRKGDLPPEEINEDHINGIHSAPASGTTSSTVEEVLGGSLPSEVREDSIRGERADRQDSQDRDPELSSRPEES